MAGWSGIDPILGQDQKLISTGECVKSVIGVDREEIVSLQMVFARQRPIV
jgi:hypothetical protein